MEITDTNNGNYGARYYVMSVTPIRLYSFTGINLLE
ncbi:Vacuolar protein sorting-associated protein 18 like protein [Castilleja foliolosa]|uniref:Vacuolar protein sorting-associated protein 18 like protein n=1 Tax=Castilleja foliolosa TaxID=1961234 RepID=A0ABD3CFN7_9LAMI